MGATPINSIPVYYNKNKRMESLKTLIMLSSKSRTGKVRTSLEQLVGELAMVELSYYSFFLKKKKR